MKSRTARDVAIEAAKAGGTILLNAYQGRAYDTREKEDTSLQTTADLAAEQAIITCIQTAFPDHAIESEEQGSSGGRTSPSLWRIDPLDGTENFVLGLPYFSTTLMLSHKGLPQLAVVYEPITGNLYVAERGHGAWLNGERLQVSQTDQFARCRAFFIPDFVTKQQPGTIHLRQELLQCCRRVLDTWSPALDWCLVASGRADLVIAIASRPIVPGPGMLILEEAGGKITNCSGQPCNQRHQRALIGSNGTELHDQLVHLLPGLVQNARPCEAD